MRGFAERYGPWAVVAGASEGLGAEFARRIAGRGVSTLLVARRRDVLEAVCEEIRSAHGVEARAVVQDLADPELVPRMEEHTRDLDVGLLVYNAGLSVIGPFLETPLEDHARVLDVNCRGPLALTHLFGRRMQQRGGGIILMSSLAGLQGSALVASYAASKAFDLVLAESLWEEMRGRVDVIACLAGATRTPGYMATRPEPGLVRAPESEPGQVVEAALSSLGRRPSTVVGLGNRLADVLLHRLMPRKLAVRTMGATMRRLYSRQSKLT